MATQQQVINNNISAGIIKTGTDYFEPVTSDGKRTSATVDYELDQTYVAIPGTIVRTLLEFPNYSSDGKSAVIELDDVMTLSYSVYRAKPPVVTLGQNSVSGYALGVKTVAGSMVRSVFMTDKLSEFQVKCYLMNQEEIEDRLSGLDSKIPSGVPFKDQLSIMKDDLAYFNIHTMAVSEVNKYDTTTPYMKLESIIGAMILNNGQIYSIEDLVTESTFSFQAKAVRTTSNIEDYTRGYSSTPSFKSISSLM